LVALEKTAINSCDIVLAKIDPTKTMIGTAMEILYAWERGKIVVAFGPKEIENHPWLREHTHAIFENLEMAISYIHDTRRILFP